MSDDRVARHALGCPVSGLGEFDGVVTTRTWNYLGLAVCEGFRWGVRYP